MENRKCKNCSHYACTRKECDIHNENGCEEFESTVHREMLKLVRHDGYIWEFERIDKKGEE